LSLSLLEFGFVLPLFLSHDHVPLREVSFNLETVLFEAVSRLVHLHCLRILGLQQFLNATLNHLAALLDTAGEGG
jgi:hypothetical protein